MADIQRLRDGRSASRPSPLRSTKPPRCLAVTAALGLFEEEGSTTIPSRSKDGEHPSRAGRRSRRAGPGGHWQRVADSVQQCALAHRPSPSWPTRSRHSRLWRANQIAGCAGRGEQAPGQDASPARRHSTAPADGRGAPVPSSMPTAALYARPLRPLRYQCSGRSDGAR